MEENCYDRFRTRSDFGRTTPEGDMSCFEVDGCGAGRAVFGTNREIAAISRGVEPDVALASDLALTFDTDDEDEHEKPTVQR